VAEVAERHGVHCVFMAPVFLADDAIGARTGYVAFYFLFSVYCLRHTSDLGGIGCG